MSNSRVTLTVEVDLDAIPGVFHTADSAAEVVQRLLDNSIGHYHPTVVEVVS